jgi:peptidoglycan/xylan/chitin deacetylase (PgdA/CDA1 family)
VSFLSTTQSDDISMMSRGAYSLAWVAITTLLSSLASPVSLAQTKSKTSYSKAALSKTSCIAGIVYLTIDTGHMEPAEAMADILRKHDVKATFFLANEKTKRGDTSLHPSWAPYWKRLADEGHAFGSHTWRHWYFRGDVDSTTTRYIAWGAKSPEQQTTLTAKTMCEELKRSESAFKEMTGRGFDPIWRAPGGKLTPNAVRWASECGYEHVAWSDAGFSGDELPSDAYPSDALIAKQLRNIRNGDILLWHLGIWSRKDPLWPKLDDLLGGLKESGFCFAKVTERVVSKSMKKMPSKGADKTKEFNKESFDQVDAPFKQDLSKSKDSVGKKPAAKSKKPANKAANKKPLSKSVPSKVTSKGSAKASVFSSALTAKAKAYMASAKRGKPARSRVLYYRAESSHVVQRVELPAIAPLTSAAVAAPPIASPSIAIPSVALASAE